MKRLTAALSLMLGACAATQAPTASFTETTISQIRKDPWAWHGKTVRITGSFDECISFQCAFCDSYDALSDDYNKRKSQCASVSFYNENERNAPASADHQAALRGMAAAKREDLARFTTSTIEARYDASCSGVPEEKKSSGNTDYVQIIMCTDRASELDEARIIKSLIWRPATQGVINVYGRDALAAIDEATRQALDRAFRLSVSAFADEEPSQVFYFVNQPDKNWLNKYNIEATGGACECLFDTCSEDDWPKREGDTWLESPANPYKCWHAEKIGGAWRFPRD